MAICLANCFVNTKFINSRYSDELQKKMYFYCPKILQ